MGFVKNMYLRAKSAFLDALYPEDIKCFGCGKDLKKKNIYNVCEKCKKNLELNNGKICVKCGKNVFGDANYCFNCKNNERFFEKARAPLLYTGITAKLIKHLKYDGEKYLARYFARLLAEEYVKSDFCVDVVVPVPMAKEREKQRGYNQATLLAEEFCKLMNLPLSVDNVVRTRNTETQTIKTAQERQQNLIDAFKQIDKKAYLNKNVLLIDDVFTTGSTTNECAKVIRASNVYVLVVAHTKARIRAVSKIDIDKKLFKRKKQ